MSEDLQDHAVGDNLIVITGRNTVRAQFDRNVSVHKIVKVNPKTVSVQLPSGAVVRYSRTGTTVEGSGYSRHTVTSFGMSDVRAAEALAYRRMYRMRARAQKAAKAFLADPRTETAHEAHKLLTDFLTAEREYEHRFVETAD